MSMLNDSTIHTEDEQHAEHKPKVALSYFAALAVIILIASWIIFVMTR